VELSLQNSLIYPYLILLDIYSFYNYNFIWSIYDIQKVNIDTD
jgi:hypothetical protein